MKKVKKYILQTSTQSSTVTAEAAPKARAARAAKIEEDSILVFFFSSVSTKTAAFSFYNFIFKCYFSALWGQCYRTFYGRKLRVFHNKLERVSFASLSSLL